MSNIADNMVKDIITERIEQEVVDIQYNVNSVYSMNENNVYKIDNELNSFTPTTGITTYITDFENNTSNFVLDFQKSYSDGSNILYSLVTFVTRYSCMSNNSLLLDKLGITNSSQIVNMKHVPEEFLDWIGLTCLKTLLLRINRRYNYPEFTIGNCLGMILQNVNGYDIRNKLTTFYYQISCLNNVGIDLSYLETDVKLTLSNLYLDNNGHVNYNGFLPYMNQTSIDNIKRITRGTQVVLNNTMNNFSQSTESSFEIPPFVLNIH